SRMTRPPTRAGQLSGGSSLLTFRWVAGAPFVDGFPSGNDCALARTFQNALPWLRRVNDPNPLLYADADFDIVFDPSIAHGIDYIMGLVELMFQLIRREQF